MTHSTSHNAVPCRAVPCRAGDDYPRERRALVPFMW